MDERKEIVYQWVVEKNHGKAEDDDTAKNDAEDEKIEENLF